jgi:sugar-specific transcriptional regulator TrmB
VYPYRYLGTVHKRRREDYECSLEEKEEQVERRRRDEDVEYTSMQWRIRNPNKLMKKMKLL